MFFYDLLAWVIIIGIFAQGLYMRYWVGKRRFLRRGPGGLQHFSSYGKGLFDTAVEGLVMWLSIPVILIGMFSIFIWVVLFRDSIKDALERKAKKENNLEVRPTSSSLGTGPYLIEKDSLFPDLPSILTGKVGNQAV
ncbi:hypothetical protein [Algoriphagus sp. A40]|uniref:hypothetical protein n=1 Tax=Algoriphagus sp. A40 TaxID=1945863 RepID=UPI0009870222|nr:hypothetical protein [Algoriphagus sp. A40]OOG76439.1 hypothetical protein B0E43_08080 [Algoriphagus sp. A40]